MRIVSILFTGSLAWFYLAGKVCASPVKISLLNDQSAIEQTSKLLVQNGCDRESVDLFDKAVNEYNTSPLGLNLSKFPIPHRGFYSFQSMSNLCDALPSPLIYANHASQLNCFEAVILLAGDQINISQDPKAYTGPFLPPYLLTNNFSIPSVAASAREAFEIVTPPWADAMGKEYFGNGARYDKWVCLTAAFNSFYILPMSASSADLKETLLEEIRYNWKRQGISFPQMPMVVTFHGVVLSQRNSITTHIGLLFRNGGKYFYLEKAGCEGPYVRLDFEDKKDLFKWYKAAIKPNTNDGNCLFATFNDTEIESFE